jgi:predicted metal-binding membrane protein
MMALMMAPTAWPWMAAFRRVVDRSAMATAAFAAGYLSAWLAYAAAAGVAQAGLVRVDVLDGSSAARPWLAAAILVGAGVYQLVPLKRACLTHCRNPISYLLQRWHDAPRSGFRLGFGHGVYCVGCCWALMATMLAVGMTHVWWMGALAAATFIEQVVPHGHRARVPLGLALVAGGLWHLAIG